MSSRDMAALDPSCSPAPRPQASDPMASGALSCFVTEISPRRPPGWRGLNPLPTAEKSHFPFRRRVSGVLLEKWG